MPNASGVRWHSGLLKRYGGLPAGLSFVSCVDECGFRLEALLVSASGHVQSVTTMATRFTDKQGQYLSFIYYYTKVNGRAPAEADMGRYFAVTPPSVHQMVLALESKGLIERTPGLGRSIRLRIAREELPDLK